MIASKRAQTQTRTNKKINWIILCKSLLLVFHFFWLVEIALLHHLKPILDLKLGKSHLLAPLFNHYYADLKSGNENKQHKTQIICSISCFLQDLCGLLLETPGQFAWKPTKPKYNWWIHILVHPLLLFQSFLVALRQGIDYGHDEVSHLKMTRVKLILSKL